jgi:5-methylcytosine-specific restriction endonuclease McrA
MADTFVERLTGQSAAKAVPVEVQLVMTDQALLNADSTPARLVGHGPIPSALARALLRSTDSAVWVRRLFTSPTTGDLLALDSRRRTFPAGIRSFLIARDEVCRTSWCDAPIRHADHVIRAADGGPTSASNGQGLCQRCNQAKEAPGWAAARTRAGPAGRTGAITLRTPTGHAYTSTAPDLPGRTALRTPMERRFAELVRAA